MNSYRLADDFILGADALAIEIYGHASHRHRIYRLQAQGWPVFKVGALWAGRLSAIRAHLEALEREAQQVATRNAAKRATAA